MYGSWIESALPFEYGRGTVRVRWSRRWISPQTLIERLDWIFAMPRRRTESRKSEDCSSAVPRFPGKSTGGRCDRIAPSSNSVVAGAPGFLATGFASRVTKKTMPPPNSIFIGRPKVRWTSSVSPAIPCIPRSRNSIPRNGECIEPTRNRTCSPMYQRRTACPRHQTMTICADLKVVRLVDVIKRQILLGSLEPTSMVSTLYRAFSSRRLSVTRRYVCVYLAFSHAH